MQNSSEEAKLKALEILISDFNNSVYAEFVDEEIKLLMSNKKESIGFGCESGGDVELEITLQGATIKYEYWDEIQDDYISGQGELDFDLVISQILSVLQSYGVHFEHT